MINNEWEFQEGDRVYLAPEALTVNTSDKNEQTTKMDVFSLGRPVATSPPNPCLRSQLCYR